LVGDHKVVNGIAETLPIELRALFRELAQVYLKEQRLKNVKVEEPCTADTLIIDQPTWLHSNESNSNEQDVNSIQSKDAVENKTLAIEQGAIPVVDHPDSLRASATSQSSTQTSNRVRTTQVNPLDPLISSQSTQKSQADEDKLGKIGLRNQAFSQASTAHRSPNFPQQPEHNRRRASVATLEDEHIAEIFTNKRSQNSAQKSQQGFLQRFLNLMFGWIGK
jgi:hypothetical protein